MNFEFDETNREEHKHLEVQIPFKDNKIHPATVDRDINKNSKETNHKLDKLIDSINET